MIIEQQSIVTSTPPDTPAAYTITLVAAAGAGREVAVAAMVEGFSSVGVGEMSRCVVW